MENDLCRIIDSLPGLIWTALPDGDIDFVNQRWCEYTGLGADAACGKGWLTAVHPEDLPTLLERWQSILASADASEIEARLRRFDGEYHWFVVRARPITGPSGRIVKWCGINSDIEGRWQIEEARRSQWWLPSPTRESDFRSIADSIPALICLMKPGGELVLVNKQTLEYFGKTLDELKVSPLADTMHPDDHARALAVSDGPEAKAGRPWDNEVRLRRADGTYRWFHVHAFPLRDAEGAIVSWYLLQTDIDDRKQTESALKRSEAFLKEAQRLSSTGGFSWNVVKNETTWSDEVYRMFEIEPGTRLAPEVTDLRIHPDDLPFIYEKVNRARIDGKDFDFDYRLVMPDGSTKYIHTVFHRTQDPDGEVEFVGAIQDVTERRRSEEALGELRTELTRVARVSSLGALTASVAHEVNQPLSGIMTNASTCLRMLAADPPNIGGARETARRTIRDANRASEVITRLRALFTRKGAASEWVDLNDAAQEVVALSLSELQRKRVILRTEFADDLPPITGDRVQLQQVILNLILNASDAMSGLEDCPRQLVIGTKRDWGGGVCLAVRDTGVGFDPQYAEKLFDAFYTTKSGGMGIGLFVSRSIVESHNGRLWAEANDGPGATFCFSIPCRPEGEVENRAAPIRTPVATDGNRVVSRQ